MSSKSFLSLVLGLLLTITAYCQVEERITLDVTDQPLSEVLSLAEQQISIGFAYSSGRIGADRFVTINVENVTLEDFLTRLLEPLELTFVILDDQVVIRNQRKREATLDEEKFTVSGYIQSTESGESLIGAAVTIDELPGTGIVSNPYGYFSLTLPKGDYNLNISYIGFKTHEEFVELNSDKILNFELPLDTTFLQEITVYASQQLDQIEQLKRHELLLHGQSFKRISSFFGENDLIKPLQSIPGITMFKDGSVLFHVRGGEKDQNLLQIDEAPIYNPAHMLGFFSTFIPESTKDIRVYKGNIPPHLGGRASSVIDIRTNEGNVKSFETSGSIGLVSTRLALEGPLVKDKLSVFVSGRQSHIEGLFRQADDDIQSFFFRDFSAKINYRPSQRNKFYFSYYQGKDDFTTSSSGIRWDNQAGTFRWNHLFGNRIFANTTLYASKYDYFLVTNQERNEWWNSHVANFSGKIDFTFFANPRNTYTWGLSIGGFNFNPGNVEVNGQPINIENQVSRKNAGETTLYYGHEFQAGPKWTVDYGFRLTNWDNYGDAFEFVFDSNYQPIDTSFYENGEKYHSTSVIEPKLNITHFVNDLTSLKWSYSRNSQFIHLISNSTSPFTSLEVWLPTNQNIRPQINNQLSFAVQRILPKGSWTLGVEFFLKRLKNQIDYKDHANMLLNPLVESELRFGTLNAMGMEVLLKKDAGRWSGWLGYTLSQARKQTPGVNNGFAYRAFGDRPHQVSLNWQYAFSDRFSTSIQWIYASGAPYTSPDGFFAYDDRLVPVYRGRNNDRFPDYHRMDFALDWQLNKRPRRYTHGINFSIYNMYGRRNPVSVNFNKIQDMNGKYRIPADLNSSTFQEPSFIYLYGFIPSLTYHFDFK